MAMTDYQVQLVVAAQNGDVKSFEELFAIYYEKVYALARMILKNSGDAEDVLQETFITAWRKLGSLETPPTFSVWLQIIAKNLCNMQLRRKSLAILLDADQDIENIDIEDDKELLPAVYAERADLRERLGRIIDSLSEVQRQAITLFYFNEMSVDEIAVVMACSVNTVKTRLFLARKAIRAEVEEQEEKSGEKFYGIAWMPMLPLGELLRAQIGSMSIGSGAAGASLNAITNSIYGGSGAAAAPVAEANAANATAQAHVSEAAVYGEAAAYAEASAADQAADTAAKTAMSTSTKFFVGAGMAAFMGALAILALALSSEWMPPPQAGAPPPVVSAPAETPPQSPSADTPAPSDTPSPAAASPSATPKKSAKPAQTATPKPTPEETPSRIGSDPRPNPTPDPTPEPTPTLSFIVK